MAIRVWRLQNGNWLIAVGTTDQARAEPFGGAPQVLPSEGAVPAHMGDRRIHTLLLHVYVIGILSG